LHELSPPANTDVAVKKEELLNVVGLFGTCGNSQWRRGPEEKLRGLGIEFFDPVVPNWTPECAEKEAKHLKKDRALLFVVTSETEGYGSLAETGWAELSTKANGRKAFFVLEDYKDGDKPVDPKHAANRARKLVKAHAKENGASIYSNVDEAMAAVVEFMKDQKPANN
jgi:hypothetical protein